MATVRGMGHWHANGAFDLVALAAVDQGRGGLVYDRTYVYEAATVVGRCVHVAASGPGRWVRSRGLGPVFDRADGGVGGGGGLGPVFDRADGGVGGGVDSVRSSIAQMAAANANQSRFDEV